MGRRQTSADEADGRLIQSVMWRRVDEPAFEHCRLWKASDGWTLDGRVLIVLHGEPVEVHYAVGCGVEWKTRDVRVTVVRGAAERHTVLRRDDAGRWTRDGRDVAELDGFEDVDLGITPATNTLPIRRLALAPGAAAPVDAAWLRFPDLELEHLPQRYTRLDDRRYRYESSGGAFVAELDVDEYGMVVRYGEFWERIASLPPVLVQG